MWYYPPSHRLNVNVITRLSSSFGIHGSLLSWFKSYLSSRPFRVKCVTDLSSDTHPPAVSPKALSLVHCSSSCTPLLSAPSFPLVPHHLYVDDTQLFLLPTHFDSRIDHLHNALDQISSWMTANLLTLNYSKTEFLLIGLSKQLAKINVTLYVWVLYIHALLYTICIIRFMAVQQLATGNNVTYNYTMQ